MNALQMRELLLYLRDVIGRVFGNFIAKRPVKPGVWGKSVILLVAVFVTDTGEDVKYFTQTVN